MAGTRGEGAQEPRPTVLEVQFHPRDIRRGVRTYFLDRRRLGWLAAAGSVVGLLVLTSVLLAPRTVRSLMLRDFYGEEVDRRTRHGARLAELTRAMGEIEERASALRERLSRIYLTYGLEARDLVGQGGYPFREGDVPDSIYSSAVRRARQAEARLGQEMEVLSAFLDEVRAFEVANEDRARRTPSRSPLVEEFVLTSPFGERRSPFTQQLDFHSGLDLAANVGTPVYAPADGVVVFAGRYPLRQSVSWWRYGELVALRHGDEFVTLFGHCDEILVRSGQSVTQGDRIATVGNSGWSTSPHLHYEVRLRDEEGEFRPIDPRIYILDHAWDDQERLLIRGRWAPDQADFEPLPRLIRSR